MSDLIVNISAFMCFPFLTWLVLESTEKLFERYTFTISLLTVATLLTVFGLVFGWRAAGWALSSTLIFMALAGWCLAQSKEDEPSVLYRWL